MRRRARRLSRTDPHRGIKWGRADSHVATHTIRQSVNMLHFNHVERAAGCDALSDSPPESICMRWLIIASHFSPCSGSLIISLPKMFWTLSFTVAQFCIHSLPGTLLQASQGKKLNKSHGLSRSGWMPSSSLQKQKEIWRAYLARHYPIVILKRCALSPP